MKTSTITLQYLIRTAAALQMAVAILNLFIVRLLKWEGDLLRMPLLLKEVFQVHAWFISITLTIFAVMTWRFAVEMAGENNAICQWLAAGIGGFWAIRTVLQVTYYSHSHWRGKSGLTLVHVILLAFYGGLAGLYLWVGLAHV